MRGPWSRWLSWAGAGATAVVFSLSPTGSIAAGQGATTSTPTGGSVAPNSSTNMLDCNGFSPTFKVVKHMGSLCTDPVTVNANGTVSRFEDNGHYIGHDEPSVKFISGAAGSAA